LSEASAVHTVNSDIPDVVSPANRVPRSVYVAIALSGLTALGAEVVWTRLLSLMFGATTYAFSIILGVFLAGLGIGSVGRRVSVARIEAAARHVGMGTILLALATAWVHS